MSFSCDIFCKMNKYTSVRLIILMQETDTA